MDLLLQDSSSSARLILLATVLTLISWLLYSNILGIRRYPKGPLPLPVIGNLMSLMWYPSLVEFLMHYWKRYGDVYSVHMGAHVTVVLNGYGTISEALEKKADIFSEHNDTLYLAGTPIKEAGVIWSRDPIWKEQRHLCTKILREQGFGNVSMQEKVNEEIGRLIPCVRAFGGKPCTIDSLIHKAVSNVIANVVFGSRFDYNDPEFIEFISTLHEGIAGARKLIVGKIFPFLLHIPFDPLGLVRLKNLREAFMKGISRKVKEHEQRLDLEHPTCFIDAYLVEIQREKMQGITSSLTVGHCISNVHQLFSTGSETTATALRWALLYMMLHPDVQKKAHEELDHVVGINRQPSITDVPRTPYIEAVLSEVLRIADIVPLAVPHRVNQDVMLNGYLIPKGTDITVNLHSVLHDPTAFPNPDDFCPERFLNSAGRCVKPPSFIPFGMGRRRCLGEALAHMELYLFFTTFLQQFVLQALPGETLTTQAVLGVTRCPRPYKMIAAPRIPEP